MKHPAKIILTIVLILGINNLLAQKTETDNLYFQALKLHLGYCDSFYSIRPDLVKVPSIYYIEKNDYTTYDLSEKISVHKIEILTSKDIFNNTNKQEISLISFRPAIWENVRLEIHVIDYSVSRIRKNYSFKNKGGNYFKVIGQENNSLGLKIINQGGL